MLDSLHDDIGASECKNIRLLLSLLLHESIPNCQVNITEYNLPQINPRVAKQTNAVDCGIFALGFTRLIINHFSELSLKSDILHDAEKINHCFSFLRNDVGMFTNLRSRIQALIMRIANVSETNDLFAVEDELSEESDIECVEVNMKKKPLKHRWLERGHKEKEETVEKKQEEGEEKRKNKAQQENLEKIECEKKREEKENHPNTILQMSSHSSPKIKHIPSNSSKHMSSRARTVDSPQPTESYKSSFSSLLHSFQTHNDPLSQLKPEASNNTKPAKREHDWKRMGSDPNKIKPKKRKSLGYSPVNNL